MRPIILAVLIAICAVLPLAAQTFGAQPYDSDWQAAMAAGSPRLRLFALMVARPAGAGGTVAALQNLQGFGHPAGAGPRLIQRGLSIGPVVSYDNNINGGTPGKTINLGGLIFQLAPKSQAKSGLILGLAPSGNLRFSIAKGTVIDAHLSLMGAHSFAQDLSVTSYDASLCAGQYLGHSDWLDLCFGQNGFRRALSDGSETAISLGFTRQFATGIGLHEANVNLRQIRNADYDKLTAAFGLTTARASLGVLEARLEKGQYISGQHTRLLGASLSLTRPIFGKTTSIFAKYGYEAGAAFFGNPRYDHVYTLGATRPLSDHFGVTVSVQNRTSTLANYDGVTFGLDFTFQDLTF